MLAEAVRALYDYNRQATGRVLEAAEPLTGEQLLAPAPGEPRSLRDTLVHIAGTQWSFLCWWDGSMSGDDAYALHLDPADYHDLASIRAKWQAVEEQTAAFVHTLRDEDMPRVYTSTLPNGTEASLVLWQMMLHVANHGTQHRSEAAAALTALGHSPGPMDLLWYFMPRPGG